MKDAQGTRETSSSTVLAGVHHMLERYQATPARPGGGGRDEVGELAAR